MAEWSPQQERALKEVQAWLQDPNGKQVFRLFGFAGSGKTTLAQHLAQFVRHPLFAAYTGKAAHVLRKKGCEAATTIHALIYTTKDKSRARLKDLEAQFAALLIDLRKQGMPVEQAREHRRSRDLRHLLAQERRALSQPSFAINEDSVVRQASLVIIDECSMVDGRMGEDLLSFGTRVLVLGDPAQLPPIMGGGFFTENVEPDIMLTEIHRQAEESPIIRLATAVRNGERPEVGGDDICRVIDVADLDKSIALEADQLLVGRNKTRHSYNRRMRQLLGRTRWDAPEAGDKLVCLRNNHEAGLLNGAIWYAHDVGAVTEDRVFMDVRPEDDGPVLSVEAHRHHVGFMEGELAWQTRREAEEFDYGYAMTVHKSQGSQWDNVLLFDESWVFRADRHRWLYTGITRAAERLTVVRV
jgi:exodeoxyribonuclease V